MSDMRSEAWSQWSGSRALYGAEGVPWGQLKASKSVKTGSRAGTVITAGSVMSNGTRMGDSTRGFDDYRDTALITSEPGLTVNAVNNLFGREGRPDRFFNEGQTLAVLYYPDGPPENNGMSVTDSDLQRFGKPVLGNSRKVFVIPLIVVEVFDGFSICCAVHFEPNGASGDGGMGREPFDNGMLQSSHAIDIKCLSTERSIRLFNLQTAGKSSTRSTWFGGTSPRESSRALGMTPLSVDMDASFVLYWDALVMDMGLVEDASLKALLAQRHKIQSSYSRTGGTESLDW